MQQPPFSNLTIRHFWWAAVAHFVGCLMIPTGSKQTYMYTHTPRTHFDADKKRAYIIERESDLSKGVGIEIQSGLSKWYVKKPLNRTSGSLNVNNTPRRCVGRWI